MPERPRHDTPDLEAWLPAATVRTSHRRESRADADALWGAASTVRLRDCRVLGRLLGYRLAAGDPDTTFEALFRTPPFVALEAGGRWALSGLCGRIWTVRGELGDVPDPLAFRDWSEPGTVRVLFAHWATPRVGGATLHSEVRVAPVDRRAARYLRALAPFIGACQSLIGIEPLSVAVRRAEQGG